MTDGGACGCDSERERDHGRHDHRKHEGHDHGEYDDEEFRSFETGLRLQVPDMDCPSCANTVGKALDGVRGVIEYDLRPTTGQVAVSFDDQVSNESVVAAVETAGYEVDDVADADSEERMSFGTDPEPIWRRPRAIKTGISALFAALALVVGFGLPSVNTVVVTVVEHSFSVSDLLYLASIAVGSEVILSGGYRSLRTLSLDMDFLMSTAILAAIAITLFTSRELYIEAASLAVLFNVAELLERYSVDRARNSLTELLELSPETAIVVRDGEQTEIPVEAVTVGETVVVEPGEKIPLDGVVSEGESAVDQSPVTGESVPVDKTEGSEVYAGTVNQNGYLEVEVTTTSADSTITRVIDLVESAQERKTEREQFVERFAGYYTPVVVGGAIVTAAIPPLVFGRAPITWLVRGIELLVIACPCAFVISTPVTVVSGLTSAAKRGVLVKGGDYLETMGEIDVVAFDKTGTLTNGELEVTDVVPLHANSESDVLRCAHALEQRSEHPIAAAVTTHAADEPTGTRHGHGDTTVENFESLTGRGVRANFAGHTHYAGTPDMFENLGFDLDPEIEDTIRRLQSAGKTAVLVGTSEELEGLIAVADTIRPDAKETVAALNERGLKTVMLTGDNERTARTVAEETSVEEFRAELLPGEKVEAIEELEHGYEGDDDDRVAMVGDGINDAPALATADVGIAMGAAGSDTAIETADIALLGDDIARLPYLVDLARRGVSVIRENIYTSLGVKAALAVLIPFVYIPVYLVILLGDVGMTMLVTGNAMRLSRLVPDTS